MKVKIKHYCGQYFTVQYKRYWWWPYIAIQEFEPRYMSSDPTLNTFNLLLEDPKLFTIEEAKEFVQSLTVDKLHIFLKQQRAQFHMCNKLIRDEWNANKAKNSSSEIK